MVKNIQKYLRTTDWLDSKVPFMISIALFLYVFSDTDIQWCELYVKIGAYFLYTSMFLAFSYVINDFTDIDVDIKAGKHKVMHRMSKLSIIVSMAFEKQIEGISGYNEIGTYLIYLFFFVIGVPASIPMIITNAPLLFVFTLIIALTNMIFCFVFGKLLKFNLEDIVLASNANIGGPTTAVAMAISKGWTKLIGPIMLIGTLGYVIGTYFGIIVGGLLGA